MPRTDRAVLRNLVIAVIAGTSATLALGIWWDDHHKVPVAEGDRSSITTPVSAVRITSAAVDRPETDLTPAPVPTPQPRSPDAPRTTSSDTATGGMGAGVPPASNRAIATAAVDPSMTATAQPSAAPSASTAPSAVTSTTAPARNTQSPDASVPPPTPAATYRPTMQGGAGSFTDPQPWAASTLDPTPNPTAGAGTSITQTIPSLP